MSMSRTHWAFLIPSLLLTSLQVVSASLPYNPAHIFYSTDESDDVYLIQPTDPASYQYELSLISLRPRSSSTLSRTPISSLPFLNKNRPIAFTPILDDEGELFIYAGDCSAGSAGSHIWRLSNRDGENEFGRQWKQQKTHHNVKDESDSLSGANFLAAGIHFNPSIVGEDVSDSSIYVFGGMCPDSQDTKDPWTSGNYSNVMLRFDNLSEEKSSKFDLDLIETNGPPTAEAGFTITPLQATYTNATEGTQFKQQDFLLIGGQTESAFINMSQVALFSLPQESWTFLPVLQPFEARNNLEEGDFPNGRDAEVEPRSGHSAVLSSDGKHIVVYGGWVGDTDTAAQPQLAVLDIGSGYGGDGDWIWRIPQNAGSDLEDMGGIYGHGATVLPDNILMIAGGYVIQSRSAKRKRADLSLNDEILFYNISSNTWLENYVLPYNVEPAEAKTDGPLSSASQKIGLSVGLVVAFFVFGLFFFFFWRRRKNRKSNAIREKNIRQLSLETNGTSHPNEESRNWLSMLTSRIHSITRSRHSLLPTDERSWQSSEIYSTDSQGFIQALPDHSYLGRPEPFVEVQSPIRGTRKPVPSRIYVTPTNPFNDARPALNAGYIHPIDEEEEEEDIFPARNPEEYSDFAVRVGAKKTVTITTPKIHSVLNPDSHHNRSIVARRASIRSYPNHFQRRNGERQALTAFDSSSSDAEQNSNGRGSPVKSDRTISSLSEQSQRSNWSATSSMRDIGDATVRLLTRSISGRSSAVQSSVTDPFITPRSSPTEKKIMGLNSNVRERLAGTHSSASSAIQSNTTQSEAAFATGSGASRLQEGEALLGGTSRLDEMLGDFERINERVTEDSFQILDTPRKNKIGWIGSVRRALARTTSGGGTNRVTAFLSGGNNQLVNKRLPANETFDVPYSDEVVANIPRRAVSDGGFWRGRRGAKDWADDPDIGDLLGRRSGDDWGGPEDTRRRRNSLIPVTAGPPDLHDGDSIEGEDWDVEAAAERRVVQVSFTVPKTRLRVVNVDADKGSLVSADERKASENLRLP